MDDRMNVGDPIRISAGVRRHANQPGFVVVVNETGGPFRQPEYGVILGVHRPPWKPDAPRQVQYSSDSVRWFAPTEITPRREGGRP